MRMLHDILHDLVLFACSIAALGLYVCSEVSDMSRSLQLDGGDIGSATTAVRSSYAALS